MNEETRSYTEIGQENRQLHADNTMLRTQIAQMRIRLNDYERAHAVAEAMATNNDVPRSVETRTYQTQGQAVDVDVAEFGRFMFKCGYGYTEMDMSTESIDPKYAHANKVWGNFQAWKANQK